MGLHKELFDKQFDFQVEILKMLGISPNVSVTKLNLYLAVGELPVVELTQIVTADPLETKFSKFRIVQIEEIEEPTDDRPN